MQYPTDELLGHRIVFALAQVPYPHANGQLIASLAPLMDLETGNPFNGAASTFPSDGYVFWGSVARRDYLPGDLIVGTLRQASGNFYGSHDQSWYQVSDADSPHGEVFEYVKTSLNEGTSLRRLVDGRKMIDASHEPPKLFFVWVNEQFVGPFHPQHFEHFQSKTGYCCKPTDIVASVVRVASGEQLSEYVRNEIGYCEVQLSSSTLHPGKGPSGRYSRRYRLIRKEDIVSYSESTQELMLLSDEIAITKACNLLEGRSAKRDAKTVLNRLVEQLRSEERQIESGIADAVVEIVSRSKVLDGVSERIASALATSDVVNARIESSVASRVE